MALTRFGLHFSSTSYPGVGSAQLFDRIVDAAQAAEAAGFDSIWVPDHAHQNDIGGGPSGPMLEAYTLLGALASKTERALLGSLVSPVTFRSPSLFAKTIATLDVVSHGRAILGIGAAWDTGEHTAYGIDFPPIKEREERLEEAVVIARDMLAGQPVSYRGQHYHLDGAWNSPQPVQTKVPILIGGAGERRTLALVARYADASNFFGDAATLTHKLGVLKQHCERVGRDFSEITTTSGLFPPEDVDELCRQVAERFATGIDGIVLFGRDCPSPETIAAWGAALQREFG